MRPESGRDVIESGQKWEKQAEAAAGEDRRFRESRSEPLTYPCPTDEPHWRKSFLSGCLSASVADTQSLSAPSITMCAPPPLRTDPERGSVPPKP